MSYTISNNTPSNGFIAWSSVKMVYDGVEYSLADGDTNEKYVYWVYQSTSLLHSNTAPTLGANDCIVFVNNGGTASVILQSTLIDGNLIVDGTIKAESIQTGSLNANTYIQVVDNSAVTRVKLGKLGNGAQDYGLQIKDASGADVLKADGTVVWTKVNAPLSRIYNNLVDTTAWNSTSIPTGWSYNGYSNENSLVLQAGPSGNSQWLWRCESTDPDTLDPDRGDGGWHSMASDIPIDNTKTYRFAIYFKRTTSNNTYGSSAGTTYFGTGGVCDLNTTTVNTNPYFGQYTPNGNSLVENRWYAIVGYVFPAGTTGHTNAGAGLYDVTTGKNISAGINFNFAPGQTAIGTRAYLFYSLVGAVCVFSPPVVNLVDGTEPPIVNILATVGADAGTNIRNSSGVVQPEANLLNSSLQVQTDGTITNSGGGSPLVGKLSGTVNTSTQFLPTGRGSALNDDPSCGDLSAWSFGGNGNSTGFTINTVTNGLSGTTTLRGINTSVLSRAFSLPYSGSLSSLDPQSGGRKFNLSCWVRNDPSNADNGNFSIRVFQYNAAGSVIADNYLVVNYSSVSTSFTRFFGTFSTVSGSVYGRIHIELNLGGTTGYHEVQDVRVEYRTRAGELGTDNLAALTGSENVNNAQIGITSGAISGIGTGSGTVVANTSISLGSGKINGIGSGDASYVDNSYVLPLLDISNSVLGSTVISPVFSTLQVSSSCYLKFAPSQSISSCLSREITFLLDLINIQDYFIGLQLFVGSTQLKLGIRCIVDSGNNQYIYFDMGNTGQIPSTSSASLSSEAANYGNVMLKLVYSTIGFSIYKFDIYSKCWVRILQLDTSYAYWDYEFYNTDKYRVAIVRNSGTVSVSSLTHENKPTAIRHFLAQPNLYYGTNLSNHTYSTPYYLEYDQIGNIIHFNMVVVFTNKGTSQTGSAVFAATFLPLPSSLYNNNKSVFASQFYNMATPGYNFTAEAAPNPVYPTSYLGIAIKKYSANSIVDAVYSDFTNTSVIKVSGTYYID